MILRFYKKFVFNQHKLKFIVWS